MITVSSQNVHSISKDFVQRDLNVQQPHPFRNIVVLQASPQADRAHREQDFECRLKIPYTSPRLARKQAEHTTPREPFAFRLYRRYLTTSHDRRLDGVLTLVWPAAACNSNCIHECSPPATARGYSTLDLVAPRRSSTSSRSSTPAIPTRRSDMCCLSRRATCPQAHPST
ncbi:hypothetical protein BDW22DRAFT_537854 [Trametopsis cervina]|nr:hypothetical protein BDW22DRAFT_537854 [Trametopsis cervina]